MRQRKKRRQQRQENHREQIANQSDTTGSTAAAISAGDEEDGTDNDWEMVPVRSVEQFVQYLVDKDPTRVRTSVLDAVPGRNTIVWYCPVSHKSPDYTEAREPERTCAQSAGGENIRVDDDVGTVDVPDYCVLQADGTSGRKRGVGEVS